MARLSVFLPRLVALTVAWLLATTALTYAAAKRMTTAVKVKPKTPVAPAERKVIVVPDVRRQAYVFAKGLLGDAGFAWKVEGAVRGYAANLVATQAPLPGTRVIDTGAPTIVLHLERAGRQIGTPEDVAPFAGTAVQLADVAVAPVVTPAAVPKTAAKAAPKPVAKPKTVVKKDAVKIAPKAKWPVKRPPLFVVPGAKNEPLDEMPLVTRADQLVAWLDTNPQPTNANVQHWLYQHAWIVAGAQLGWWQGDEALRKLIVADQKVWSLWGIGARSADVARRTLAEVEARKS
jgi:hypothetical protein